MYRYLIVIVLFTSCSPSVDEVVKEELSIIYENAKELYSNKQYDLAYKSAYSYWQTVEEKGYKKEASNALNLLGATSRRQGKFPEALGFYLKAVDLKEVLGDSISMSNVYNNIGNIYKDNEAYEEALRYHSKAIKIHKNAGDQHLMEKSYRNTGIVYWKDGQYQNALHYFNKSIDLSRLLGNQKREAYTSTNIAVCYRNLKDYVSALQYYNSALAIWKKLDNKQKIADIYNNLAVVYINADSLPMALDYAFQSIELNEKEGSEDTKAYAYNILSDIYHLQGQTDKVIEYAEKCIPLAEKYSIKDELFKAYEHAYERYYEKGDIEKSHEYLKKSRELDKIMDKERERFYKTALSQVEKFQEVENQHQLAKASMISAQEKKLQRNYFILFISGFTVCFVAFGLVLARRHYRLQQISNTFPAYIRHSLSKIEDIFFYVQTFPEEAPGKLQQVDGILDTIDEELRFFLNRVKKGIRAEECFDPSIHLNNIIDNFRPFASSKRVGIIHDITEGHFIQTRKKTYLIAFEHLLRNSIKSTSQFTPVNITLWKSANTLWLEIQDFRPDTSHGYKERSYLKQLEDTGGIVTITNRFGKSLEIAIGFDLA